MNTAGLLDTSIFVANETGRSLDAALLPERLHVSVVTIAELHAGVLAAVDIETRANRLRTLESAQQMYPLGIDAKVAAIWARLRVQLAGSHRRANVNDLWIAAVALANSLPVCTQDHDFDILAELDLLKVIKV